MATISDLNTSITQMLPNEAQSLVKQLRESRRIVKKTVVSGRKSTKTKPKVEDLIPLFTDEQKQQLLALLEGE